MNKEVYECIVNTYDIGDCNIWRVDDEKVDATTWTLHVESVQYGNSSCNSVIARHNGARHVLFHRIPSRKIAYEIIKSIPSIELLLV